MTDPEMPNPEPASVADLGEAAPGQAAPGQADPGPPDPNQAAQTASGAFSIPAPSVMTGGSSTATATTSLAGSGLQLDGGAGSGEYALASYMINTGAMHATMAFTVNPAPGASFTFALRGTGGGYSSRFLRLQRVPGSDALQAVSANGAVACGALPAGQPTPVTLSFDGATQTFDVLLAGAPTACTHLPTKAQGPVVGFRVIDETIQGYGGHVDFTSFTLASP